MFGGIVEDILKPVWKPSSDACIGAVRSNMSFDGQIPTGIKWFSTNYSYPMASMVYHKSAILINQQLEV
jgi:hypothetical protein